MILRDTKLSKIGKFSDFKGMFKGFHVPFRVTKLVHTILCRKLIPFSYSIEEHRYRMAKNLMPDMTVRLFHGIYLYLSKKRSYLYSELANDDHVKNLFPLIRRAGPTLYRNMHLIFLSLRCCTIQSTINRLRKNRTGDPLSATLVSSFRYKFVVVYSILYVKK